MQPASVILSFYQYTTPGESCNNCNVTLCQGLSVLHLLPSPLYISWVVSWKKMLRDQNVRALLERTLSNNSFGNKWSRLRRRRRNGMQSPWWWPANHLGSLPDKKQAIWFRKLISGLFPQMTTSTNYLCLGSPGSRFWDGNPHTGDFLATALEINSEGREAKKAELVRAKSWDLI